MGLTLTQAPAEEPISLTEAKLHLRVDGSAEDALITALIGAARRQAEHLTGRALVTQKWKLTCEAFPASCEGILLPYPALQSVQSVTYLDEAGQRQTLSSGAYQVVTDEIVGRVVLAYGESWPAVREVPGSLEVSYTAGFGAAAVVPQDIKNWMLLTLGTLYVQREAIAAGALAELPRQFYDGLLDPYRTFAR